MAGDVDAVISWLHLSDVHIGRPGRKYDTAEILGSVGHALQSVAADASVTRPDFLFFTGDLAFGDEKESSLPDQFAQGAHLISEIRRLFSPPIPQDAVFIVLGNHDVNRKSVLEADKRYLAPNQISLSDIEKMVNFADGNFQRILNRQDELRNLLRDHFAHIYEILDKDRLLYCAERTIRGWKVRIAGLNSSWSCCQDGERGRLWMGGRAQWQRLRHSLEGADYRIALFHHPPWWLIQEDAQAFWPVLESKFDVALHGHEHMLWIDANQFGHVRVAAGALYEHSRKPVSFNLVTLHREGKWGQIWLRRYNAASLRWVAEEVPESSGGVLTLDRFGLVRPVDDAILLEANRWLYSRSLEEAKRNYRFVTILNLAGRPVKDLSPLAAMPGLQILVLRNTLVENLLPLRKLLNLEKLGVGGTRVRDLEPLKGLSKLVHLSLANSRVANLEPLRELTALKELDLRGTRVADLGPLDRLRLWKSFTSEERKCMIWSL